MDVEEAVLKGHEKCGVAGDARPERDHPVAEQGLLRLLRREGRRETEPQDDAALPGALLPGEELVAVALRQVGGEKDLLLQDPLLPEPVAHEVREGMRAGEEGVLSLREKTPELLRTEAQHFLQQLCLGLCIAFVLQVDHPFLIERRPGVTRAALYKRGCKFYERAVAKWLYMKLTI